VLSDPQVAAVYLGTYGGEDSWPLRLTGREGPAARCSRVKNIAALYGAFHALHDISSAVGEGEVLALSSAPTERGDHHRPVDQAATAAGQRREIGSNRQADPTGRKSR